MNFSDFLQNPSSDAEKIAFFKFHEKRGISPDDMAFAVEFFQKNPPTESLDICGTGGSGLPRINTSTLSAFVLSALGVPLSKHGNRAASGRFGSFDLLEKLGITIDLDFSASKKIFEETGLGFFFRSAHVSRVPAICFRSQDFWASDDFQSLGTASLAAQSNASDDRDFVSAKRRTFA